MLGFINKLKFTMTFNEPSNFYMKAFVELYNFICMYLIGVVFIITFWLVYILVNHRFRSNNPIQENIEKAIFSGKYFSWRKFYHVTLDDRHTSFLKVNDVQEFTLLEATWVVIPISFIGLVAYPSIGLEYGLSPDVTPLVTVKAIGHQWYWEFEIQTSLTPGFMEANDPYSTSEFFKKSPLYTLVEDNLTSINDIESFDNLLLDLNKLDYVTLKKHLNVNLVAENPEFLRMVAVDNKIILPVNVPIKIIVTSADVLHSFALPNFALKMDAVPGRSSEQVIISERPGLVWGQCSELCGPYHGFMPIVLQFCSINNFIDFMLTETEE